MQGQPPNLPTAETQALPLRDIMLPAEPGFWPLAPGWWVLIVLMVVVLGWLSLKWFRHHRKKKRWQTINEQLSEIEFSFRQKQDSQRLLTELSAFLRRFVKYQLKQTTATSLAGNDWITYLDQYDSSKPFSKHQQALTQGPFQANCDYDAEGLLNTTRSFIKQQVMKPTKREADHV